MNPSAAMHKISPIIFCPENFSLNKLSPRIAEVRTTPTLARDKIC